MIDIDILAEAVECDGGRRQVTSHVGKNLFEKNPPLLHCCHKLLVLWLLIPSHHIVNIW